jgi:hypothetical protein
MTNKQVWQIEALFRAKQDRRKELAKLSFDKKIKILVELQKMSLIPNNRRKNKLPIWDIA